MVREIDEAGAQKGPDERRHREQDNQPLLIEPAPGVAGQDHEPGPAPRQGSRVSPVSAFIYRHLVNWIRENVVRLRARPVRRATARPRRSRYAAKAGFPLSSATGGPWLSGRSPPACLAGA